MIQRQTPAPGPISQAESLLAALGMRPIVTHEIEIIDDLQWRRARDMQFEINKTAHALVTGTIGEPMPSHERPGYMNMLRDLNTPYRPDQVEAMLEHIPEEMSDASGEFLMLAQNAFAYLGAQLPRQVAKSLSSGATPVRPPERLLFGFNAIFDVLDDPVQALELAAEGALLKSQVVALDAIFPTLTAYMRQAIAAELVHEHGEDPSWSLPYAAEVGLQRLLGADLTSTTLKKILQLPPPRAQQPDNQQQPKNDQGAPIPMQLMTRTQRTDVNTP